jgi:hypothetical protein
MKKIILVFIFNLFLSIACFAQSNYTESLTITTYYPAPYGVYRNLRLYPSDQPADDAAGVAPGVMYFNQTDNQLYIYKNDTTKWQPVGGGAGNYNLINGKHTEAHCNAAGGFVADGGGDKMCKFNATECPGDWNQYEHWSTTKGGVSTSTNPCGYPTCSLSGGHDWANRRAVQVITGVRTLCGHPCLKCFEDESYNDCQYRLSGMIVCNEIQATCVVRGTAADEIVTQIGCY